MNEVSEQARALLAAEFAEPYADLIRTDHYEGPETIPVSAALRAIEKALALSASSDATGEARVDPSHEDIERARKFLRGLRRPTINRNVPEGVAIQAMLEWHEQEK